MSVLAYKGLYLKFAGFDIKIYVYICVFLGVIYSDFTVNERVILDF